MIMTSFNRRLTAAGLGLACLLGLPLLQAADSLPPGRINFQGFLADPSGLPLGSNAPVNVSAVFRIYRTAGGTSGADILWAERQTITVDRGYYSVVLGSGSATGNAGEFFTNNLASLFLGPDASERYLGVKVANFPEVSPRVQFMAPPFAQNSRATAGLVDPNGKLLMSASPAGLGINLTNPATATLEVGGTVRAASFVGDGSGLTNVTTSSAKLVGTLAPAQIADGAITTAKLTPGTVPGLALAAGSVDLTRLSNDAVNVILSQAGGVGSGGGVFSLNPTNTALTSLGFVNIGSKVIGGDKWVIKSSEVAPNVSQPRYYVSGGVDMRTRRCVWTGTQWILWGGTDPTETYRLGDGAMFDPVLNTWTPMSSSGAPSPRDGFQEVWLGDRMWLYGGYDQSGQYPTNVYYYYPATDQWTSLAPANGPGRINRFSAVWTGTEILVFGGGASGVWQSTGARYNPAIDTWRSMAPNPQASGRGDHYAQWTGSEMIIAGGNNTASETTGVTYAARYNPVLDNWTPMPPMPFPSTEGECVWTGTELIILSGYSAGAYYARYNLASNTWSGPFSTAPFFPIGRTDCCTVWTGKEMLIVGGYSGSAELQDAARFNPTTGVWTKVPDVPKTTAWVPFTWTGKELLIFADHNVDKDRTVISYSPPIEAYHYVKQ